MFEPALVITDVTKTLHAHTTTPVHAVRNLSLTVERGEIVAFLGPNGAGKSTTLDMVLGLTTPTSGTVQVLGMSPREAITAGRVAAVLQSGGLLADLTVGETVGMIAHLNGHHLDPAEAMRRAGIEELDKRRVSQCSGGEQQRLRFALALLPEPDLLILDEPTAGMDVNARHEFWATMRAEAHEGRTIIFATHYLEEAEQFAERVAMIANGALIADGHTDDIRRMTGRKTVTLQWPDATAADLAAIPHAADLLRTGARIEFATDDADAAMRYLLTATPATEVEVTAAGLDDAFTQLIHSHN